MLDLCKCIYLMNTFFEGVEPMQALGVAIITCVSNTLLNILHFPD
jgi:hypothetical protein